MGTGEGEVEYDAANDILNVYDGQRERGVSAVGWTPTAFPFFHDPSAVFTTAITLPANGGSIAIPMIVPAHMLLADVTVRNLDTATARTWGWDLYVNRLNNNNASENTVDRVVACTANETFTPSAASSRFVACPITYLAPGVYWLVIQNRHATNTFAFASSAHAAGSVATGIVAGITKTTTNPNGATLDLVAATWAKQATGLSAAMRGRVLGMGAVI
jgi:hypothetical protein